MTDSVLNVVLGVVATAVSAALGWLAQSLKRRRRLERIRAFFGMPAESESLLVVNRRAGSTQSVARNDVYALMELSALVKECGARAVLTAHDEVRQGLGGKAEFCLGGPASNDRTAAHLAHWLPGVRFVVQDPDGPHGDTTIVVGDLEFPYVHPSAEPGGRTYALLARLSAGPGSRPVFLIAGQTSTSNHAAVRHLVANRRALARKYGAEGTFALILRVIDPAAYGPDVVEQVADVTAAATTTPTGRAAGSEAPAGTPAAAAG